MRSSRAILASSEARSKIFWISVLPVRRGGVSEKRSRRVSAVLTDVVRRERDTLLDQVVGDLSEK